MSAELFSNLGAMLFRKSWGFSITIVCEQEQARGAMRWHTNSSSGSVLHSVHWLVC
jgi:hypothetical protein